MLWNRQSVLTCVLNPQHTRVYDVYTVHKEEYMKQRSQQHDSGRKEVRAWGVRRTEVDNNQLALAYYLLARRRIEQTRDAAQPVAEPQDSEAA